MKKFLLIFILITSLLLIGCGKSFVLNDGINVDDTDSDDSIIVFGEGDDRTTVLFDDDGMHVYGEKNTLDLGVEGLKIENEDGEITKVGPDDGSLKYDSQNGTDIIMGDDIDLPDEWPADLLIMDSMKIKSVVSTEKYILVTGFFAEQPTVVRNYFRDLLNDYENYKETNTDNTVTISGRKDGYKVKITLIGFNSSSVTIVVENE